MALLTALTVGCTAGTAAGNRPLRAAPFAERADPRGISRELVDISEGARPALVRIQTEARVFKPLGRYLQGLGEGLAQVLNPHPYWEWPYRVIYAPLYLLFGIFDLGSTRGSGFFVGDRLVLTNAHVVENAAELLCQLTDGRTAEARVVAQDAELDLALLELESGPPRGLLGPSPAPLPLRRATASPGELIVALGFPSREPLEDPSVPASESDPDLLIPNPRITVGIVSAIDVELGNARTRYLETDAALNPGSSGGPILGLDGEVLGVATFVGVNKEDEGYAVPIESAIAAFDQLSPSEEPRREQPPPRGGAPEEGALLRRAEATGAPRRATDPRDGS